MQEGSLSLLAVEVLPVTTDKALGEARARERAASKATSDAGCVGASSAMLEVDMATI
jgi:hypothetical protein